MTRISFLPTVSLTGVQPQTALAIQAAAGVYSTLNQDEMVVTSVCDGEHSPGSLHYVGLAFDIRLPGTRATTAVQSLKAALSNGFDVVLEATHIHVEHQPKTPINRHKWR